MSEVPVAREKLHTLLKMFKLPRGARRLVREALSLMTREKAVRRAPGQHRPITLRVRQSINQLAPTDLTMAQIARRVGLRSQGRVSEVLNRKRRQRRKRR